MLLTLGFILAPAVLVVLCQRVALLDKIGVVVISFVTGIALAAGINFLAIPDTQTLRSVQLGISEVSIALALPLLLFSIDIRGAVNIAGNTLKAMLLALLSITLMSTMGAVLFSGRVTDVWQVAGMSVGTYTGGGPNMAAIKAAIDGDESVFVTMVTYDVLFSALYLIFVMTVGQRLFGLFLRRFRYQGSDAGVDYAGMEHMAIECADAYKKLVEKKSFWQTLLALICSALVVGVSVGLAGFLPESMHSTVTIICITTLGLLLSFVSRIRRLVNSFPLGMYLILVFCFTTGTMTDTAIFSSLDYALAAYMTFILAGSMALQSLLCKLTNVDRDTFLITSSAAIMSVPFIPVIAGALKNREVLLPGFAAAILGYAVGNYLGIIVATVSRWLVAG